MIKTITNFIFCFVLVAVSYAGEWVAKEPFRHKLFIENKGQYDEGSKFLNRDILYFARFDGVQTYFTKNGLTYRYDKLEKEELESKNFANYEEKETAEKTVKCIPSYIHLSWEGANPNVQIIAEEKASYYFTYGGFENYEKYKGIKASAYKKITYKNLYPNIDVEYIFPENKQGIKYNIILYPGADASLIKMKYSDASKINLNANGSISIKTFFGEIIDNAPTTFYDQSKENIYSKFSLQNGMVVFQLSNYDKTQKVVIDPWTTVPNFTGYDAGYDVDYDLAGNVYAHGGDGQWGSTPYQVIKFNSTGTILWVFDVVAPFWGYQGQNPVSYFYSDFAVDVNTGSIYIGEAFRNGGARLIKADNAGIQVTLFTGGTNRLDEMWRIEFDNVHNKLIIGGGNVGQTNNGIKRFSQIGSIDTSLTTLDTFNTMSATGPVHDIVMLCLDNCGNYFAATPKSGFAAEANKLNNVMFRAPTSTMMPRVFLVNNGYQFRETNSVQYVNGGMGQFSPGFYANTNSFNGIAANKLNLFTYDGCTVKKWAKNNGANQGSVSLTPADTFKWGGIDADDCGNIYVGGQNTITRLDVNLNTVGNTATPDEVYDVKLAPNNILLACGKAFVASFNATPCTSPISNINVNITLGGPCNAPNATASASGGTPNYSYSWSPSGGASATTGTLSPGTYTVTVTDNNCDSKTATITVSNTSINTPTSSTPAVCAASNGSATVTPSGGTPGYTYSWAPTGGNAATANNLAPGTYTVTVTDNNNCSQTATVTVGSTNGTVTVSATSTPALCTANNGTATATGNAGTPGYTYSWSTTPVQNSQTATGLAPGTYTVTVTDNDGCTNTTTVTVGTSNGNLTVTTTTTPALCTANNGTATATPSGGTAGFNYSWTPSGGNGATASNLAPGTYTVQVTDASGCTATATATVGQSSGTLTVSATTTPALCTANNGTATATPSGGTAGYTYSWTPSGGAGATASNLAPGTYTVMVTDASGCTSTTTAIVGQSSGTLAATVSSTPAICGTNNGSATVNASGGTPNYSYSWSPGGATSSSINNLAGGTYTVIVTDASGCTQLQTINVASSPGPTAGAGANVTIDIGQSTTLNGSGGGTYNWFPATNLSCTNCQSPVANPFETTTYCVEVTDNNGCKDTACVTIRVEVPCPTNESVAVPNAFSPNKDGVNDEFCLQGWDLCLESFVVVIFDRWGEKVFESIDPNFCWDGKYLNREMDAQVFVYHIKAIFTDVKDPVIKKGNISLIK